MPMRMLSMPGQSALDSEAAAAENAVVMRHEMAFDRDSGRCRSHAGEHASLVFGEGVEERSDEHIARHTPERIEVDMHSRRPPPAVAQMLALPSEDFEWQTLPAKCSARRGQGNGPGRSPLNLDQFRPAVLILARPLLAL
jgi:hypothetical protein